MGSQANETPKTPLTRRQVAAGKRALRTSATKTRKTGNPRPACRIDRAIRATKVNAAYINRLIAEHSRLNLAGHTLKSLLQVNFGAGAAHGLPLNGLCGKDREIGAAFDAVKQALGEPGRAFYYYA